MLDHNSFLIWENRHKKHYVVDKTNFHKIKLKLRGKFHNGLGIFKLRLNSKLTLRGKEDVSLEDSQGHTFCENQKPVS